MSTGASTTADRIVDAAARLLDEGGQAAVTLRAVATATDLSHNAPYKHFGGRDDLLGAVATRDLIQLAEQWRAVRGGSAVGRDRILDAVDVIVEFARDHPARYRLLFGAPDPVTQGEGLDAAAETALQAFVDIVVDGQREGSLPASPSDNLGIMLFATVHGLIGADAGGRLRSRTGWADIRAGMDFVIGLLRDRESS
ncbi:TetR/AcrR family transcriptional regulator [Schumannella luteola]|uniref:AcrR family transcriptional regulator n=1 Tax=Schumannella luteola TaxID=472059 RepID=A0A852YAY7_9MICO|nr:TetR/AcrR family transcriptional regulator [Schumannella luteola]NYG98454.1 AcrR family transcriptional regulator [Schumannella luteola]